MKQLLLLLVIIFFSCAEQEEQLKTVQGNAFGTTYAVQYFSSDLFDAQRGIDSVVTLVNQSVSTYMPESDISRINRGDNTVVVDSIFREVFSISETIYKQSKGYFDPTIGVLRNAYGFGEDKPLTQLDAQKLDSLRKYVGFQKVSVSSNGTIKKKYPEIYIDFNAVAKGYGIDKIGAYLERKGVTNYLIELGGELLAKGKHISKNKPWVVGIEATDSPLADRATTAAIPLIDKGMAASGNYRKFRVDSTTGKKYVHTINPLTGLAEQSDVTSATVTAPTCALADAYATAFMAMGFENSKSLLEYLEDVDAYLTYTDSGNIEQVYMTSGMESIIKD